MPIDPEKLLWELSGLEEEDGPIPDDAALQDWQQGRLGPPQAEQVERLLARSPEARRRLGELSGLALQRPSPELRRRVLASLKSRPRSWSSRQKAALAAAAAILLLLAAQLFWLDRPSPPPAFLPDYQMQVFAAAEVRNPGSASPSQIHRVGPQTQIRIELSARSSSSERADYGLYRLGEGRLERLAQPQGVSLQVFQGAARFQASGSRLATHPGRWQLYALVAGKGHLPAGLPLQRGESPEAKLKEASGGQVFPLQIELLADAETKDQKGKEEEQK